MFTDTKKQFRDKFTIGFTFHAECYCHECGEALPDVDPEGNDKHPIATWDRAECPEWVCAKCELSIQEWGY